MATNTSKYLLKKPAYSDTADIGDINDNMDSIDSVLFDHAGSIAVICMGNVCAVSVSTGQYVLLQKSTIAGRTDGLHTAAKAIPANTVIDSSYLTAVSGGIANALNGKLTTSPISTGISNISAAKNGKICEVVVNLSSTITVAAYNRTLIGSIASDLAPYGFNLTFPCVGRLQGGTSFLVGVEIRTNGNVYAYNTSSASITLTAIEGAFAYIAV